MANRLRLGDTGGYGYNGGRCHVCHFQLNSSCRVHPDLAGPAERFSSGTKKRRPSCENRRVLHSLFPPDLSVLISQTVRGHPQLSSLLPQNPGGHNRGACRQSLAEAERNGRGAIPADYPPPTRRPAFSLGPRAAGGEPVQARARPH
jgi:hypothetical protein